MARKKSEGVTLGRPLGRKSRRVKLSGKEEKIRIMLQEGVPQIKIAKKFNVNRNTLAKFIKENSLKTDPKNH